MAFSAVTERGSFGDKVDGTTLLMSPSGNIAAGQIAFVWFICDNTATVDGDSTNHDTVSDTDGNTWNKVFERTRTEAGVAADGVTHSLWWSKVTTQIDTSDTITVTMDTARTAKVMGVFEVTVEVGNTIQVADDGTPTAFSESSAVASLATSGMTSGEYLHLGMWAREEETPTVWTEDTDYTNVFAAESINMGAAGPASSNVIGYAGYRIATLTGDTFLPSGLGASADSAGALIAFEEVVEGGGEPPAEYLPVAIFRQRRIRIR